MQMSAAVSIIMSLSHSRLILVFHVDILYTHTPDNPLSNKLQPHTHQYNSHPSTWPWVSQLSPWPSHPLMWTRVSQSPLTFHLQLFQTCAVHPLRTDQNISHPLIPSLLSQEKGRGVEGKYISWCSNWWRVLELDAIPVANQCGKHPLDLILSSTTNRLLSLERRDDTAHYICCLTSIPNSWQQRKQNNTLPPSSLLLQLI